MSINFINNIKILNYKCYDNIEVENLSRVNLIGGENNTGKTAFMEALYLSSSINVIDYYLKLIEIYSHRDIINNLLIAANKQQDLQDIIINTKYQFFTNINTVISGLENQFLHKFQISGTDYTYEYSSLIQLLDMNIINTRHHYTYNFISPSLHPNYLLDKMIGDAKLNQKYTQLNENLKKLFNVDAIDMINSVPMVYQNGVYKHLHQFGQGMQNMVHILGSMLVIENQTIFIDEIESGIHYTKFDLMWRLILGLSKEKNIQVFATTHSKECIESYAKVSEEDEEVSFVEFGIDKNKKIDAIVMNGERFHRYIKLGNEVRGW